jgi:hypothetical protein
VTAGALHLEPLSERSQTIAVRASARHIPATPAPLLRRESREVPHVITLFVVEAHGHYHSVRESERLTLNRMLSGKA